MGGSFQVPAFLLGSPLLFYGLHDLSHFLLSTNQRLSFAAPPSGHPESLFPRELRETAALRTTKVGGDDESDDNGGTLFI
jgi:hypothetical protein